MLAPLRKPPQARPFVQDVYNFVPGGANVGQWRAAKARVKNGQGRATLICIGDSTTAGIGAGSSGGVAASVGARVLSMPMDLATSLTALGVPAIAQNVITGLGSGGATPATIADLGTYAGLTFGGADWTTAGVDTAGARTWFDSTGTTTVSWTPTVSIDTLKLFYVRTAGTGTLAWAVDGGTANNIATAGANGFVMTGALSAGALASHTLTGARVSGTVYFGGFMAYDSTTLAVDILNLGWTGSGVSNWTAATNGWDPLLALSTFNADAALLQLAINDDNGGTTVQAYLTGMQTLIDKLVSLGVTVFLFSSFQFSTATQPAAKQSMFRDACRALATRNNLVYIDGYTHWGNYVAANFTGPWGTDTLHPNAAWYSGQAAWVASILAAA